MKKFRYINFILIALLAFTAPAFSENANNTDIHAPIAGELFGTTDQPQCPGGVCPGGTCSQPGGTCGQIIVGTNIVQGCCSGGTCQSGVCVVAPTGGQCPGLDYPAGNTKKCDGNGNYTCCPSNATCGLSIEGYAICNGGTQPCVGGSACGSTACCKGTCINGTCSTGCAPNSCSSTCPCPIGQTCNNGKCEKPTGGECPGSKYPSSNTKKCSGPQGYLCCLPDAVCGVDSSGWPTCFGNAKPCNGGTLCGSTCCSGTCSNGKCSSGPVSPPTCTGPNCPKPPTSCPGGVCPPKTGSCPGGICPY